MLVDHAARCRFECSRQCRRRLSQIVINQPLELRRLVPDEKRVDQDEDLRLALAEVAHELHEEADVALLLTHERGRRMLAGAREPGAVARALNLDEALGAAADCADLLAERGAAAAGPPCAAKGTDHSRIIA